MKLIFASVLAVVTITYRKEILHFVKSMVQKRYEPHRKLIDEIQSLPLVQKLDSQEQLEFREFAPAFLPSTHLIRGTLYRTGCIEYARSYFDKSEQTLIVVMKLGDFIDGHQGIVHGGLIAAIFDDIFGEIFYSVAQGKYMGFTASLKIDYRHKMSCNSIILVKAKVDRRDKRKVFISGEARECTNEEIVGESSITDLVTSRTLYAECEALFIIPKENYTQYLETLSQ